MRKVNGIKSKFETAKTTIQTLKNKRFVDKMMDGRKRKNL